MQKKKKIEKERKIKLQNILAGIKVETRICVRTETAIFELVWAMVQSYHEAK